MAILAISVAASGRDNTSLSEHVAKAVDVLRRDKRVKYELGPMFTTVEGEIDDLFDVAKKMHVALVEAGAPRISTVIKIDDRRDTAQSMERKVESVKQKLA